MNYSLPPVAPQPAGPTVDVTHLTADQKAFVDAAQEHLGMSESMALKLLKNTTPEQQKKFVSLMSGDAELSRNELKEFLDLNDAQFEQLFGDVERVGIVGNAFNKALMTLLIMSYSFEVDIKGLMQQMLKEKISFMKHSAEERKDGAQGNLWLNVAAAIATIGVGLACGLSRSQQFPAAMTAGLFSQPLQSIGQYLQELGNYDATLDDSVSQEADAIYNNLVSIWQSSRETQTTIAGLS